MKGKMNRHAVSGMFVFALLGMFALLSTILVLLGAQAYRGIVARSQAHNAERVRQAFVRHVVRTENALSAVKAVEEQGLPALCIADEYGLVTYIYAYEGQLKELYQFSEDEFTPERGENVCEAQSFAAEIEGNRLTVRIVDGEGKETKAVIALCGDEVRP